jgi:hypothetical protein
MLLLWLKELFGICRHYWGVPHRRDGSLISCCYACGKERLFKDQTL